MDKETKEKIVDNLEKSKKYIIFSENDFNGGFIIGANNLKEAEEKVMDLIDIHEVNDDREIID